MYTHTHIHAVTLASSGPGPHLVSHLTSAASKAPLPQVLPHPLSQSGLVSLVSDFHVEYFILVILFFVLSLAWKKSRARIGVTFVRRRKSFPSAYVFRSCDIPYILATVLEVRQCFVRIKASLTVAAWVLKRPLKDEKKCQLYVFELDSIQALPEGIPLPGVWKGTGRGGKKPGMRQGLPEHKEQCLLSQNDICFPG